MINPKTAVDSLVTALQSVPQLVSAMGGNAQNIQAYHDVYPSKSNVSNALRQLLPPGMLVLYRGYSPGNIGEMQTYKHLFTIFARAEQEDANDANDGGYYQIIQYIADGVPQGSSTPLLYTDIILGCWSMDLPKAERKTDRDGRDYFEITLSFPQYGDLIQ